ncbi:hypothetical protein BDV97DRAFT_399647 [Delphinella strobiligena]|nr:hypothetical protein BDV97DRAFT_399647 [Delphinella strobiligena]
MDDPIFSIQASMKTTRTADYPSCLIISFSNSSNILARVKALRRTWRSPATIPAEQQSDGRALSIASILYHARILAMSEAGWLETINNQPLDGGDINTPWRDFIYWRFEKICTDTRDYLLHTEGQEMTGNLGSIRCGIVPIYFADRGDEAALVTRDKDNTLLLSVWLAKQVRVRLVVGVNDPDEVDFDDGSTEICWIKARTKVRYYIEGASATEGLAALMFIAHLS